VVAGCRWKWKRGQAILRFCDGASAIVQFLGSLLTFTRGVLGMDLAALLTWIIQPMPLYSEFYKTANHEGDIFYALRAA